MRTKITLGLIGTVPLLISLLIFGGCTIKHIQLDRGCTGYLKRAGDSNTVSLAVENLDRAIKYMDEKNLDSGYTSVIYETPDEDIGFWYKNVTSARDTLKALPKNASELEISNALMKLRETLLDEGERGPKVTYPDGLSRYPSNGIWAVGNIIATIFLLGGIFFIIAAFVHEG